ncbi:ABC transporter ATP-binding protein [Tuwongella immobilis]|nr:ABC transporter ATP-binding protein [Tuwongella immobilis]
MMPPVLTLESVSIRYGDRLAVDGLSLELPRGEMFGLLGPNGSGKSSTLGAIAGCRIPSSGTIRLAGIAHSEQPTEYARQLGFVPQELAIYDELTVKQNLRFFGDLFDLSGLELRQRTDHLLDRLRLLDCLHRPVRHLSGGMQRRVNLAVALLHQPALLLLDEPTVALDPESRECLFGILADLRNEGQTVLLTTHLLDEAERWCDRIGILQQGRLVAEGSPAQLAQQMPERVLVASLPERPAPWVEKSVRHLLPAGSHLEITGNRVRLVAESSGDLGRALALLLKHGFALDRIQSPGLSLEEWPAVRERPALESASAGEIVCDAA